MSFVFVLAYAESLFLLLLFAALLLAVRRRYAWIAPLGVIAAFTRPGALALALALGILFVVRFARRARDPFPPRQLAGLLGAGIATAGAGLAWPVIADAVTGFDHAYVRTETAWWIPFVGRGDFAALTPWFRFGIMYAGVFGVLLVLAAMVACAWWVSSAPVRRLGIEVVAFAASYALYLFAGLPAAAEHPSPHDADGAAAGRRTAHVDPSPPRVDGDRMPRLADRGRAGAVDARLSLEPDGDAESPVIVSVGTPP